MKASTALQLLTAVMTSQGQERRLQTEQDVLIRTDLDLGACLDVESLYSDTETQLQQEEWAENVHDVMSSSELTSSDEHSGPVVTNSMGGVFLTTADEDDVEETFPAESDNATFLSLDLLPSVAEGTTIDFSQFGSFRTSAALSSSAATELVDSLKKEYMQIRAEVPEQSIGSSYSINIPSSLWNIDLTSPAASALNDISVETRAKQDVKETLKSRLFRKGSVTSASLDSDLLDFCTCSQSSSTSSLSLSVEDDDADDAVKQLERREKNRLAAQKCRHKKRDKTETLQKDVSRLEEKQERLKEEVQKLRDERETLEQIINVHGMVCPKIRKISNS